MKKRLRISVLIVIIIIGPFIHNKNRTETGSCVFNDTNSDLRLAANDVIIQSVPYYSQIKNYYCGPACLEMVFDYFGNDISQYEIADAARTDFISQATFTDDMRRATHFSNLSTSVGDEMVSNIIGYTNRKIGYGAFENYFASASGLLNLIDAGYPIIVLQWYDESHSSGHFRVVIGYNRDGSLINNLITHDPWIKGYYRINYATFMDLWAYSGNWGLFISPWDISITSPSTVVVNSTFTLSANVEYVCPTYFDYNYYTASTCNATIQLPPGFSLSPEENPSKSLPIGELQSGDDETVQWRIVAETLDTQGFISVNATGFVSGSTFSHASPGYSYTDLIGGSDGLTVTIVKKRQDNFILIISSVIIISVVAIGITIFLLKRRFGARLLDENIENR
ncbi:MAG: C39 family peptidase [Candidatus Lokiarchaeota archaeon]|nr:C39 family peptidase [Candidatus Lokiarchaeota archaeon]